jgi:hypothetical protein
MLAIGHSIRYRIAEILDAHWDEFFRAHKGWIRPVVLETVRKLRLCRTPALGCHVYHCTRCNRYEVVPHSCKSRFCSTCGKQATDQWADRVLNDLPNVPYHHLVLSVPWQLRPIIAMNRQVGLSILMRAGAACLNQWAGEQHGMRMGIITVLHTFGSNLKWHTHLHLIVTEGGLSLDGERWVRPYDLGWLISHASLKKMWRYHVIRGFRQAHKKKELRFPASDSFRRNYPGFNWLLNKLYSLTWYAHIGACLLDPSASVRYIGRYTKRAVLAEYRITYYDGKKVRFAFRDYANGGKTSFETLPVFAFLRRLIRHIPDKHFKMVRHSGIFAPRWKDRYLEQARAALAKEQEAAQVDVAAAEGTEPAQPGTGGSPERSVSLLSWEERQRAQGRDPLRCPSCGEQMRLKEIAFGLHSRVEEYFRLAGRPVRTYGSVLARPP